MANAPVKKAVTGKPAPGKPAAKSAPAKAAPGKTAPAKAAAKTAPKAEPVRINTADLAKLVKDKLPLATLPTVTAVINATIQTITEEFKAGNQIVIKDFGKFELKDKPARKGRNPATGETIDIAAKIVPKFTFATALKNG